MSIKQITKICPLCEKSEHINTHNHDHYLDCVSCDLYIDLDKDKYISILFLGKKIPINEFERILKLKSFL